LLPAICFENSPVPSCCTCSNFVTCNNSVAFFLVCLIPSSYAFFRYCKYVW
jgi:hypothetical protein